MEIDHFLSDLSPRVGYITDVEGNLPFWTRYIEHSSVLSRVDGELILKDNCQFVYGGDSCDRGSGDLQVLRDLISLKVRHPDRVHLLMGNRDINKLRFPTAMLPEVLSLQPECYFALSSASIYNDKSYLLNDRVSKMKWILTNTMGSPYAFEYRRQELQRDNMPSSDADVTDSFCNVMDLSDGLMLRYLELAQVVAIIGDVMFLHGAIHDFNQGFVPYTVRSRNSSNGVAKVHDCTHLPTNSNEVDGYVVEDPFEWCEKINSFAASEIQDFKDNITSYLTGLSAEINRRKSNIHQQLGITDLTQYSDRELAKLYAQHFGDGEGFTGIGAILLHDATSGYFHPQPGSGLIQYGMGVLADGSSTRSVIYSSYLHQGRPRPCSCAVAQWLLRESIECALCEGDGGGEGEGEDSDDNNAGDGGANDDNDNVERGRKGAIRRLVVGHQPHADAPLVLHVSGVQIISADSSYSINTQWPLSQLQALFPSNSNIIIDDSAVAPVLPAPAEEEEWLSFTEYMIRYHACSHTNSNNSVDCSVCTDNLIPAAADTRCPRCIAELLFVCGDSAHCTNSDGTSAYPGYVHGVLSQGSCYVSALNDISGGDRAGYDMQAVSVGCETKDGWYIKATNVRLPSATINTVFSCVTQCTSQDNKHNTEEENWYYLLAHSSGYTFRNQLVARGDIATHFM